MDLYFNNYMGYRGDTWNPGSDSGNRPDNTNSELNEAKHMIINDSEFNQSDLNYDQSVDRVVYIVPALEGNEEFEEKLQALILEHLKQQPIDGNYEGLVIRYIVEDDCDGYDGCGHDH